MPRMLNQTPAPAQRNGGDAGSNVSGVPSTDGNRYVGFEIVGFFNMGILRAWRARRNGRPGLALAVASLAQGVCRVIDRTRTQFGDVGVSHQSNPAPA
jgi:hypothetical protein